MAKKEGITTVSIDLDTATRLDRVAKDNNVPKKVLVSLMLDYFERYGINPVEHESPAQEMQKLIKRVDQVVAFMKVQERDILRPMAEAVMTTEQRINADLASLVRKESVNKLTDSLNGYTHDFNSYTAELKSQRRILTDSMSKIDRDRANTDKSMLEALKLIAEHLDEKGKQGLISKLFG